jgi:two-component system OmpR family response regulator
LTQGNLSLDTHQSRPLPHVSPKTILVCEDDPSLRLLFRLAIEQRGHRVVDAGDGGAAIALARSARPDLVVVDMNLPDLSGVEVVRILRTDAPRSMPILMATGSVQPDDRMAAEDAGVDSFLAKPFTITELVDEIERLLTEAAKPESGVPLKRLQ